MKDNMDEADRLLKPPFYLHSALLRVIPQTHDKELYKLQTALLKVNYANLLLRQRIFELEQT